MMKNSTVSRRDAQNERVIRQIFEYNGLEFQSSYMGMVQNYVSRCFDANINLMPVINTLKKLNSLKPKEDSEVTNPEHCESPELRHANKSCSTINNQASQRPRGVLQILEQKDPEQPNDELEQFLCGATAEYRSRTNNLEGCSSNHSSFKKSQRPNWSKHKIGTLASYGKMPVKDTRKTTIFSVKNNDQNNTPILSMKRGN